MFAKKQCIAAALFFLLTCLAPQARAQEHDRLRVGVAGNEPFVSHNGDEHSGLSVDVWEKMAVGSGISFDYVDFGSVGEALAKLGAGELDAVVGPVTITAERQQKFEFTQPYFSSSLGIVSRDEGRTLWGTVKPFFSKTFFVALTVFLIILAIVGFLVWVAERRSDDGPFSRGPVKGLGNGVWLALVTMTTVGYGDLSPRTVLGRIVLGGWMVVALVSATSFLAGLAGTIALSGKGEAVIETAADLAGEKVAVVRGGSAEDFVRRHEGAVVYTKSLEESMKRLQRKEVSAVVFDRPQLRHFLRRGVEDVRLSPRKYRPQGYGFAFAKGYARSDAMNVELLRLQESGFLDETAREWFPTTKP